MGRDAYSKRHTVQECRSITSKYLNQLHCFDGDIHLGDMNWNRNGGKFGNIGFVVSTVKGDEYISFQYTHTGYMGETTKLDYKARLDWTYCHFGGRRWWFICPLITDGRDCQRRVGALYLGGSKYFGCRHCYNLTYKSCKEHDKHVDALCKEPELLSLYFQSNDLSKLMLAIKAQDKLTSKYKKQLKRKNKRL